MVLVFLRPADEDPAVTVEPAVAGLDDPASGAPAGSTDLLGDLADFGVVVGPVKAEALRRFRRWLGALDRDRVERSLQELVVVGVRSLVVEPDRDALPLAEDRSLRPFLALSVGFGPVFGPPNGALVIAPSAASHDQSIPTASS